MVKTSEIELRCSKCGYQYSHRIYDLIVVDDDPSMRDKVLDGDIFVDECPHCHAKRQFIAPFIYQNNEKNFAIHFSELNELLTARANMPKKPKQTVVGVDGFPDFATALISLENGFDYRIVKLVLEFREEDFKEYAVKHNLNADIDYTGLLEDKNENGDFIVAIKTGKDENTEVFASSMPKDLYDIFYKMYIRKIQMIDPFVFNNAAMNIFIHNCNYKIKDLKDIKYNIYYVQNDRYTYDLCRAEEFIEKELKMEERVIYYLHGKEHQGVIKKVRPWNEFTCIYPKDDLGNILCEAPDVIVDTTVDSDASLKQFELLDNLKVFKDHNYDMHYFPFKDLENSNFIFCIRFTAQMPESDIDKIIKKGEFTADEVSMQKEVKQVKRKGKNYLVVYTEQEFVPNDGYSKFIYTFDDIVRIIKVDEDYDGVIINPDEDETILGRDELRNYIYNKFLFTHEQRVEFINNLLDYERHFLGDDGYELISADLNGDDLKVFVGKYGKTLSQVKKRLNDSYIKIQKICYKRFK